MRYVDTEAHYWTDDFVAYLRTRSDPPKQVEVGEGSYQTWFEPSAPELSFTIRQRLVSGLNEMGVPAPGGEVWTTDSFTAEMKRLAAPQGPAGKEA